MEMGFSKIVAEKALFMTQGASIEKALEWIEMHSNEPDFEEELFIVGQEDGPKRDPNRPKLSKEEALQKAKELQETIRKKRKEEEKKQNEENEKQRIASTKMMQEAKRKLDEQLIKNNFDAQKREKKEFMDAKQQMLDQLRRDKEERFGKSGATEAVAGVPAPKKEPPLEIVKKGIKTILTLYTEERQPGVAKTCFKTLAVYMKNVLKVPQEEKY